MLGRVQFWGAQSEVMNDVTPWDLQSYTQTLEVINTEITASLTRQSDAGAKIDTKAGLLVGYAVVASSFLATRHAQPVLAALAYAAYALAAAFGIWAYAVRMYQDVPEPRQLFNSYLARSKAQTLAALAATRVEVFESNEQKHARKARRWWLSVACLVVGVTSMLFALTSVYW